MALSWNESAGRFVNARGQFVSEQTVRLVIDDIADGASARMAALSQAMLDGNLSLAEWQAGMMRTIKLSQLATATIAHGGQAQMGFPEYGASGRAIRDQYDYLRGFAADIASGRQPLTGGLTARARQYGQAARVAFEREYGRDQMTRGYRFERNILGASEHCSLCPELSARGWVPIGSLPPIGSRPCRAQDRCRLAYSREEVQAA